MSADRDVWAPCPNARDAFVLATAGGKFIGRVVYQHLHDAWEWSLAWTTFSLRATSGSCDTLDDAKAALEGVRKDADLGRGPTG